MASPFDDKTICKICVKKVIDKGVECESTCNRWFHPHCVNLSSTEYKKIADGTIKSWICGRADCSQPENISKTLEAILSKFDSLATKDDVQTITNDISALRHDIIDLANTVSEMQPRLHKVEQDIIMLKDSLATTSSAGSQSIQDACAEMADRSSRASNVILRKIPEGIGPDPEAKKLHDRALIGRVFEAIGFEPQRFSFYRLGRPSAGSMRPVKIMLPGPDAARDFFRKFSSVQLSEDVLAEVTASRDRTPNEVKHLDELRKQLNGRIGNGEPDLTIKYINGVPKIVRKAKN